MNQKSHALLFLSKNYHPFTDFSSDMLRRAGDALRIFEVKGGEVFTLQASGEEDYLFVIDGCVNIKQQDQPAVLVDAAQIDVQPILFSEILKVSTDSYATFCHVDIAMINDFLSLKNISDSSETEDSDALIERLMFLKSTRVFRLLPVNVVEEAAKRCEELTVKKGDLIIRQYVRADDFYILLEGKAEVLQKDDNDNPQVVALLGSGDSFGKKALVIGSGHKSSVKMITDGMLLRISKADFEELVSTPSLRSVSPKVAQVMLENGAKMIDVRYEEEYEKESITDSVLFPLPELRNHISSFDTKAEYLILCAVGLRAAAATLMLRQQNINAHYIEGGIKAWPFKTEKKRELELILFDFCPFAQRAVITLQHTGLPHKLTYLDPDNLPDWFATVSPFGKVPILRVDGDTTIFESSVINEMISTVSNKNMLPSDPVELSVCKSWIEFGSTLLSQLTAMIMLPNKEGFQKIHNEFINNLRYLEAYLASNKIFARDELSLVDSTYAPLFMRMDYLNQHMGLYKTEDFANIQHWMNALLSHEAVITSVRGSFSDIYYQFIQRKGSTGYLTTVLASRLKEVA